MPNADEPTVRIPPLPARSLGVRARAVARVTGWATRGEPPRVFTTLARHRRLFWPWLRFSRTLLLRSTLPRRDVELVILRTAWNCASWYEWVQHVGLAGRAGLPRTVIAAVAEGAEAPRWTPRQRLLLMVADELHERRVVTDVTWAQLLDELTESQVIELCLLVGHYEMLAMTLNSLGVEPEPSARHRLDASAAARTDELSRRLTELRHAR